MDKLTCGFGLVAVYGLAGCGGGVPTTVLDRLDSIEARLDAIEANETGGGTGGGTGGDLEGRVAALEDVVGALDVTVDDLVTGQGALATDVADLQSQLDGLSTDVTTVQGDVTTLVTDVGGLQSDLVTVQADVGGVQTDLVALQDSQAAVKFVTFTVSGSIVGTDTTMHDLGALTVTPSANGQYLVIATGYLVFFGQGRTVEMGIGDTATALDTSVTIGDLDGTGTLRVEEQFAVTAQYTATAGVPATFHVLALGNSVFDTVSVNLVPENMAVVFVPDALP